MQAYLQAASKQRNRSVQQLNQQCLAQNQQLKDAEEEYERYKALLENQRQKAEAERAPLDTYLAKQQSKLDAGVQRFRNLKQQLEAHKTQQRYLQHKLLQLDRTTRERAQLIQQLPGGSIILETTHDEWQLPYINAANQELLQLKEEHAAGQAEKKALQAKLKPLQEKISVLKGKKQLQDCKRILRPAARGLKQSAQSISAPFPSTRAARMHMKAHHLPVRVAPRASRAATPPAGAHPAPVRIPQMPSQPVSNGTTEVRIQPGRRCKRPRQSPAQLVPATQPDCGSSGAQHG